MLCSASQNRMGLNASSYLPLPPCFLFPTNLCMVQMCYPYTSRVRFKVGGCGIHIHRNGSLFCLFAPPWCVRPEGLPLVCPVPLSAHFQDSIS